MLRKTLVVALIFLPFTFLLRAQTKTGKEQTPPPRTDGSSDNKGNPIEGRVEKYLRNLYAWGPSFDVKAGPSKPSPISGLMEIPVTVSKGDQSDTAVVYASKDGAFLIRGELSDMNIDPFADTRSKLHIENSPMMGPENAKVTLVEFADLECPVCRQLDLILRDYLPQHPGVRLVFKHFPLTQIHPWAMTAALATQCAFQQSPPTFWKMHDQIFDSQDVISPSNVWDKMIDLAGQQGLNIDAFKTCLAAPETANKIKESIEEGNSLSITATPTTFVNGRRLVGPDKPLIDQYVSFSM